MKWDLDNVRGNQCVVAAMSVYINDMYVVTELMIIIELDHFKLMLNKFSDKG